MLSRSLPPSLSLSVSLSAHRNDRRPRVNHSGSDGSGWRCASLAAALRPFPAGSVSVYCDVDIDILVGQVFGTPALRAEILVGQVFGTPALRAEMFPSVCLSVCPQKIAFFVINLRNLVKFAQIWQNSSDFFDFLLLFDFQMSESKRFSLNLPLFVPKASAFRHFRPIGVERLSGSTPLFWELSG